MSELSGTRTGERPTHVRALANLIAEAVLGRPRLAETFARGSADEAREVMAKARRQVREVLGKEEATR